MSHPLAPFSGFGGEISRRGEDREGENEGTPVIPAHARGSCLFSLSPSAVSLGSTKEAERSGSPLSRKGSGDPPPPVATMKPPAHDTKLEASKIIIILWTT